MSLLMLPLVMTFQLYMHVDSSLLQAGWLKQRLIQKGGTTSQRVLVSWHGLPASLTT
jgi:hypothetical protein